MLLLQRPFVLRVILMSGLIAGGLGGGARQATAKAGGVALCPIPLALLTPEGSRTLSLRLYPDGSCEVSVSRPHAGRRRNGTRIRVAVSQHPARERPGCFFFSGRTYCE